MKSIKATAIFKHQNSFLLTTFALAKLFNYESRYRRITKRRKVNVV